MAKKTNSVTNIGFDFGFGVTKVVPERGDPIIFPSVQGHAHHLKFQEQDISNKYPGDMLTDDEGDWFMGDLALSQLRTGEILRLRGRSIDEGALGNAFRVRLMKSALSKLYNVRDGNIIHLSIATGLPVDHMADANSLKEALIGQHKIETNSSSFIANITDCMVMPQPYGTIYNKMLTTKGDVEDCYTYTKTGVVDVGTYTVDATVDDDGEYIDTLSGSAESGVYLVQDVLSSVYERDYRSKPDHKTIEHIIRTGCLRVKGEAVNYKAELAEAVAPLRDATIRLISNKWGNTNQIDVIWLSGGGAALVADDIKRLYPQARLVDDFQTANARGYLNYALFKQANS